MDTYNFVCFGCDVTFSACVAESELKPFRNKYGKWDGVRCQCGKMAKRIGKVMDTYMPEEIFFNDGKNRKISRAHLEDIRSRAVTPEGTVLRGKEGLAYNYARGAKPSALDYIRG
jgi:hypothetical protein